MKDPFSKPNRLDDPLPGVHSAGRGHSKGAFSPEVLKVFAGRGHQPVPLIHQEKKPLAERIYSWLMSVSIHIIIMILLALLLFPTQRAKISPEFIFSDHLGDQLEMMTLDEGNLNPTQAEQYALEVPKELRIDNLLVYEKEPLPFVDNVQGVFFDQSRIEMRDLLSGRTDPGTKNDLIAKYGGNKLTSESVRWGLIWLAKQQDKKLGSWSLKGPYQNGRLQENTVAATGMALLAFEGDGNTRFFGEYKIVVQKGWRWLLRQQKSDGGFYEVEADTSDHFYGHAICTIALCELLAMEQRLDSDTRDIKIAAERAIRYLLDMQNKELGGWRYIPGIESDLSATGWCLMALQTARMAEMTVPQDALERVSAFLDKVAYDDGSQYAYMATNGLPTDKRPSMTATGLLCRVYLGWDIKNPALIKGAEVLILPENLIRYPRPDEGKKAIYQNVYGWYSASLVLKQLGPFSKYWRTWNKELCSELPNHQEKQGSLEAGSWNPSGDEFGFAGGRLYVTCLSILCLEVYYRHLALFR